MDTRSGRLTIKMDGRWDIEDLSEFAEGLEGVYGFFACLFVEEDYLRRRIDDLVQREFWNRPFGQSHVGERVYGMLPDAAGLKILSIRYASPGAMEIAGLLGVLLLLAKVVREWTAAGTGLVELYEKIEKFFSERPLLRKPARNFNLGAVAGKDIDDARELMFELGRTIGLTDKVCERVLDMAGNPLSGLKFIVALALQARNVSELERRGLLELPAGAVREAPPEGNEKEKDGEAESEVDEPEQEPPLTN
ncbi:MAG: hypothetical protein Q7U20_07730 [Caulobacter sp.]|nr:hypothetical protein [Caulobacter sp.]